MKRLSVITKVFLLLLISVQSGTLQAQSGLGSILGWINDDSTKVGIPFVNITVFQNGQRITSTATELDGIFRIKAIKPQSDYMLKISTPKYQTVKLRQVHIKTDSSAIFEIALKRKLKAPKTAVINSNEQIFVSEAFGKSVYFRNVERSKPCDGVRDIDGAIGTIGTFHGTRGGATNTYIDGVKVRGSSTFPKEAYADTTDFEILNGIPAKFENKSEIKSNLHPE